MLLPVSDDSMMTWQSVAEAHSAFGIELGERGRQVDHTATVMRSDNRIAETLAARPKARGPDTPPADALGLTLGPVIGRGGMGTVRLARQSALKRTVAVKEVARQTDETITALLREAWIAGNLEHPNILPIYALSDGTTGPLLVMRRIEGVPWSAVLADPEQAPEGAPEDPLAWHLTIFMEVCRAVHFAHQQGLVHLDIKPANVMLGRFGEVYLVDWGLAASLDAEAPGWMPRAGEISNVVGTPAYMAPELALGAGHWIDERTDVYLLGAVLHHVLSGKPPHTGTVANALEAAYRSAPPALPDHVPAELVQICAQAMARQREERHADVDQLRRAIDAFLQHRHAKALTAQALARLAELDREDADPRRIIDEVCFGLRLALRAWPEQPDARMALDRIQSAQVDIHLERKEWRLAQAALAEMDSPAPALRARVEAALAARADAARKAEALARDNDLQLNIRPRVWWVAAIGFAWLIVNFAWGAVVRAGWVTFDHRHLLITSLCTLGAYLGGACAVKHTLRAIAVDRRIIDTIGAGLGVAPVVWIVGACLELPPLTTVAMSTPLYFFGLLVLSICVEERVRWLTPFLIPPAIIAGLAPDYAFEMCGVAGFICGVPTAWIWARVIQEEDAAESPPVLTEMQAARARYRVALEGWSEESGVNA